MVAGFRLIVAASKSRAVLQPNQVSNVTEGSGFNGGIELIRMPANHVPAHPITQKSRVAFQK
jgi:hypothetical protein